MNKLKISLSAKASEKPITDQQVKSAKSILDTAAKQKMSAARSDYKDTCRNLTDVRKQKDKELRAIEREIASLNKKHEALTESYDRQISKLVAVRDKKAEVAGIIVQPRASKEKLTKVPVKPTPAPAKVKSEDGEEAPVSKKHLKPSKFKE